MIGRDEGLHTQVNCLAKRVGLLAIVLIRTEPPNTPASRPVEFGLYFALSPSWEGIRHASRRRHEDKANGSSCRVPGPVLCPYGFGR